MQQKKIVDPGSKTRLLKLTTQAVERLEQLKQKREASAPGLDELLDNMPPPPSTDPQMGSTRNSTTRGGPSTAKKFMGMCVQYSGTPQ